MVRPRIQMQGSIGNQAVLPLPDRVPLQINLLFHSIRDRKGHIFHGDMDCLRGRKNRRRFQQIFLSVFNRRCPDTDIILRNNGVLPVIAYKHSRRYFLLGNGVKSQRFNFKDFFLFHRPGKGITRLKTTYAYRFCTVQQLLIRNRTRHRRRCHIVRISTAVDDRVFRLPDLCDGKCFPAFNFFRNIIPADPPAKSHLVFAGFTFNNHGLRRFPKDRKSDLFTIKRQQKTFTGMHGSWVRKIIGRRFHVIEIHRKAAGRMNDHRIFIDTADRIADAIVEKTMPAENRILIAKSAHRFKTGYRGSIDKDIFRQPGVDRC